MKVRTGLSEAALREIVREYEDLLVREGSEVGYGDTTRATLVTQAVALVNEVADRFVRERESLPVVPRSLSGLDVVHASESLRAALALFQAAYPVLLRELPGDCSSGKEVAVASLLHRMIMEWLGHDTGNYLNYLLRKTNHALLTERQQMARELHDRIAHTISIALQSIELHEVYEPADPARARAKLRDARTYLREVLDGVRRMSMELREPVYENGLGEALAGYLRTDVPADVRVDFACAEDAPVPLEIGEEVYLVMREAIHNSVRHGSPTEISVTLCVTEVMLSATVRDDGVGFDKGTRRSGVGLTSMRERVELLGGRFVLKTGVGQGTTIEAHIPFLRGLR